MYNPAQSYLKTQVTTTSPVEVVVMLYDGAIRCLCQAKGEIEARNYARKGILISKTLDIIAELDGCLNVDKGGELAANMHRLYFLCKTKLLRANSDMDTALLDEVVHTLRQLRSAFVQIKNTPPGKPGASDSSSASL